MECIETILQDIEVGCFFDSHFVVDRIIRDFSDDYLRIAQNTDPSTETLTLRVHQQIGNIWIAQSIEDLLPPVHFNPIQDCSIARKNQCLAATDIFVTIELLQEAFGIVCNEIDN